jgi:protease-4
MAIRKPRYLKLVLSGKIQEDQANFPFFRSGEDRDFREILELLTKARKHPRIQCLMLVLRPLNLGWGQAEELQAELKALRAAGKATYCYLETGTNLSYYLAAAANQIVLPPSSNLDLVGLRVERFYYSSLLQALGIHPELFNIGEFKSAAEVFTRDDMSPPSREMTRSILASLQDRFVEIVSSNRRVTPVQARGWINGGPYTAHTAKELGLVDALAYEDQLERKIEEDFPGINPIGARKLLKREGVLRRVLTWRRPQIAYIVTEGLITQGPSRRVPGGSSTIGSDTLQKFLEHTRQRKRIKGVVVRVNSPGGGALASDLIWRQLKLTAKEKPVIASFGNIAASGGYYLACGAQEILAMPGALTGSIGVIGGKFSLEALLEKLKVRVDSLDRGEHAGYQSATRSFSEEEKQIVQAQLITSYQTFVARVAEARKASDAEIEKVAGGRVWTGTQAFDKGLVDTLGGLLDAFSAVRAQAGIPRRKKIRIVQYSQKKKLKDLVSLPFMESLGQTKIWALLPFRWVIR